MPYALGIDLGSGQLAAAICRNDRERWSEPEVLALDGTAVTEAVLHLTDEGTVEVGDRALRHVTTRPDRVTRGFVDRVGDEIPITLGGQPYPAEVLIAAVVGWIADYAEASEGMPASQVVVTHPAGWGTYRRSTLQGALREVGLPELTLLPRPVAAAESYAAKERVEVGQEIAVHSLGAGRFESAVLRRGSFGFELRAHADAGEQAGGDLFDDLLAAHVLADLGHDVEPVALAKLRVACRTAKERLSTELAVTVPAPAKSPRGTVMVNRTDVEELIRPAVEATVASLQQTIQAAGTSTGSLQAVVLVGGCGRIPLVSELVSAGVRVRVTAAADPELSVARGAALAAARVAKPTVKAPALASKAEPLARSAVAHTDLMRFDDLPEEEHVADVGPPPPRPPVEIAPLDPPKRRILGLGTRSGDDSLADLRDDEPRPARRDAPAREYGLRPRRTELSGADLFTPLDDDSSPALFTHADEDSEPEERADRGQRRPVRENSDPRRDMRRKIRRDSQQNLRPETTYDGDQEQETHQDASQDSWHRHGPDSGSRDDIAPYSRHDFDAESRPEFGSESRHNFSAESRHHNEPEPGYDTNPGSRNNIHAQNRHDTGPDSRRNIRADSQHYTDPEPGYDTGPDSRPNNRADSQHHTEPEPGYDTNPGSRRNIRAENRHDTGPDSRRNIRAESRHHTESEAGYNSLADSRHTGSEPRRDLGPGSRPNIRAENRHDAGRDSRRDIRAASGYDIGPDNRHDLGSEDRRSNSSGSRRDIHADSRRNLGAEGRNGTDPGRRHNRSSGSRHDIRAESRDQTSSEDPYDIGSESRRNNSSGSRRDIHADSQRDVQAESRHHVGPESRYDLVADGQHDAGPESRRDIRSEARHDNGASNRHDLGSDSRHDIRTEPRHDNGASNRHDLGSDSRRDIRADSRHDNGSDNRHVGADTRYDVGSSRGRNVPAASRHESREVRYGVPQERRREIPQEAHHSDRHEAGQHNGDPDHRRENRHEVPQEGSHRSRHEGGRRHRSDDRAFNESLTRARHTSHGDGEDPR